MNDVNNILATDIVGVAQAHCGHYYRWLFTKEEVNRQFDENDIELELEEGVVEDILWPMGGSNSSATSFTLFNSDDDVKKYLTTPELIDYGDPMLVDIGEYMCDPCIDGDDGDITLPYMEKLGLSYDDCSFIEDCDKYHTLTEIMVLALENCNCMDFDFLNPFYGHNRGMRFSELCELYEQKTGSSFDELKRIVMEKKYDYDLKRSEYTCFCTSNFSIIQFFKVPFLSEEVAGAFYLNEDQVFKAIDGVDYYYAYGESTDEDFVRTEVLMLLGKSEKLFLKELKRCYEKNYEDFVKSCGGENEN
ncbi:MAG: hypothetical protein K6E47_16740 [Lachnospiraceae bacterium]|nr:hypothetical protein [Lachnospiraceae bacterium]